MALPNEATALEQYFDDFLFTGAYLNGSKGLAPLGKKVLDVRKKVKEAVAARNERTDEQVLANVAQAIAWDGVAAPLASFERQTDAHFDADRAAYGKVFGQTVANLLRASEGVRGKVFQSVLAFARKSGHTGKLATAAKELAGAWDDYLIATKGSKEADAALSAGVAAVSLAKRKGIVAMREIEGTLRTKYAEDPKEWRKFFRTKAKPKAKAKTGEGDKPPATTQA